jgi:hypothetical protein
MPTTATRYKPNYDRPTGLEHGFMDARWDLANGLPLHVAASWLERASGPPWDPRTMYARNYLQGYNLGCIPGKTLS